MIYTKNMIINNSNNIDIIEKYIIENNMNKNFYHIKV